MPDNSDCNIATADALTLLLHNQYALAAAMEEITSWLSASGGESVANNAVEAMQNLVRNAKGIIDAMLRLPQA